MSVTDTCRSLGQQQLSRPETIQETRASSLISVSKMKLAHQSNDNKNMHSLLSAALKSCTGRCLEVQNGIKVLDTPAMPHYLKKTCIGLAIGMKQQLGLALFAEV